VNSEVADRLERLSSVTLERLDERASLLRRVDRKYALQVRNLVALIERLGDDHDVLEIDGRRWFSYRTVYFDTSDLRCFWDHVNGEAPRFKARTRLYEDTDSCVFEVKLKRVDGEMDKRQIDHPPERGEQLTEAAVRCLREALRDADVDSVPRLAPTLGTRFRRITLGARDNAERLTCDLGVRLSGPDGSTAMLAESIALLETKTEQGHGRVDRVLAEMSADEISLSKYRVGISLLGDASTNRPQPGNDLFMRI
jgi:hypothetical protein